MRCWQLSAAQKQKETIKYCLLATFIFNATPTNRNTHTHTQMQTQHTGCLHSYVCMCGYECVRVHFRCYNRLAYTLANKHLRSMQLILSVRLSVPSVCICVLHMHVCVYAWVLQALCNCVIKFAFVDLNKLLW